MIIEGSDEWNDLLGLNDPDDFDEIEDEPEEAEEHHERHLMRPTARLLLAIGGFLVWFWLTAHTGQPAKSAMIFITVAELFVLASVFWSDKSPRQRGHHPGPSYFAIYFGVPITLAAGFITEAHMRVHQLNQPTSATDNGFIPMALVLAFIVGIIAFVCLMQPRKLWVRLFGYMLTFMVALLCEPLLFHYAWLPR